MWDVKLFRLSGLDRSEPELSARLGNSYEDADCDDSIQ